MKKRKNRKRNHLYVLLIILFLFLGLGYAALTTNLSINGISHVTSSTWDVHWENVQVSSGSVDASTPTITNQTTVSFNVTLTRPGDFFEFTVDAKNDGTVDAMIETITSTLNGNPITTLPVYMIYTLTYADGAIISSNQPLLAGEKETYRVRIEYNQNINPSDLPTDTVSYNLTFGMDYLQKSGTTVPIRTIVYNVSDTTTYIGNNLPDITVYDNYQDALNAFGKPFLLKHVLSGDKVIATYVGFALNQNVAFIQGGVNEIDTHPVYESNKVIMKEIFGENNCYEWTRDSTYKNYHCSDDTAGVSGYAATDGYICSSLTGDTDCSCYVHPGGSAACNDN